MRVIDSQIRFAVNIDCNIPDALIGDETRIRQVLLNIINNAVKYTEKGFVSFTISGEIAGNDIINLSFEVMDSGKGIKEEDTKKLFGDYAQFDIESNRGIEGVGLGLAISWNIVKAMGGDISVYSEYGMGSIFTVKLPQKISSHKLLTYVKNPEEKNTLVFERREIYAVSIFSAIDSLGINCTLVSNDMEFQEKLSNCSYSFIFISYSLLEKNRNTISKLGKDAKVVVLSEFGESIPDKNLSILATPVYSISIANAYNGISDHFNYSDNDEHIIRFTAPLAKILIVDDISTNLKVAKGLMLPYKMQVDLCQSGREAIESVQANRYDLVFMDHKMPEMDGVEAMLYIRALDNEDPYYKNIPIIILTANAVSGIREKFLHNGFNDFLSKPIDTVKLNSILEKWIPKEKKRKIKGESIEVSIPEEQDNNINIEIEGIDIKRGIFLSGRTMELYLETLTIFHSDGLKKIDEINSCLDKNNLSLFTIHIHALKSALANIGADELSETAKSLEKAGDRNDINYIKTHINDFFRALESLLTNIKKVISTQNENDEKNKKNHDLTVINPELIKLKTALNSLDAGTINNTIDYLRTMSLPKDIDIIIQNISGKILMCEYDDAIALIEELLPENNNV